MPLVDVTASGISSSSAEEADRDERPLGDVAEDAGPVQALIEDQPRQEVQQHVEKREQPEHAPQLTPAMAH